MDERIEIMWFPWTSAIIDYFPRDLFGWLREAEQQEVDRLASQYAMTLYGKPLDQLTAQQASRVLEMARSHFRK
jgi:hypothetical protein